jgi:hypothetical protein
MSLEPDDIRATWRCTLPPKPLTGEVGVAFNMADGRIVRLMLDAASAAALHQTLAPGYNAAQGA